jgi:hypothetical protein
MDRRRDIIRATNPIAAALSPADAVIELRRYFCWVQNVVFWHFSTIAASHRFGRYPGAKPTSARAFETTPMTLSGHQQLNLPVMDNADVTGIRSHALISVPAGLG